MVDAAQLGGIAGILFIVMSLSIPLVYIVARYQRQRRAMELRHAERMAAIECGMEISLAADAAGEELEQGRQPRTALLPGLVWFFIGIAICASLTLIEQREAWVAGFIPIAIGLAYLIYYFAEERNKRPIQQHATTENSKRSP